MINQQKVKYLLKNLNDIIGKMKRYIVSYEIYEEVEVDDNATEEEIVEKAISQVVGHGGWFENDLTQTIKTEATIEESDDE